MIEYKIDKHGVEFKTNGSLMKICAETLHIARCTARSTVIALKILVTASLRMKSRCMTR